MKQDYNYYIMTVKMSKHHSMDALVKAINYFKPKQSEYISEWYFEFDSYDCLHMHTIIQRPVVITKLLVHKCSFWVHYESIPEKDIDRVLSYISKDGWTRQGADLYDQCRHKHMDSF